MLEHAAAYLTGKGLWLENAAEDLVSLRAYVRRGALSYLIVRVADGADALNWDAVSELHHLGLPIWGAVRLYRRAPAFKLAAPSYYQRQEAETAIQAVHALRLSGLVLEAREGWDEPGGEELATDYVQTLRAELSLLPLALSSWSYPPAHANFPGREFRAACAVDMPFVFSAAQLGAAHHIFSRLTPTLAFAPVVPAFASQHFNFSTEKLTQILTRADELNLPALSVWDWRSLQQPSQSTLAATYTGWRVSAITETSADENEADTDALMAELHTSMDDEGEELPEHLRDEADEDEEPPKHLQERPKAESIPWLTQDTETGAVFFSENQSELTAQPVITHFFKALRTDRLAEATACYAPEFTHINPQHVTRNLDDVVQFYSHLFTRYTAGTLAVSHMHGSARLVAVSWTLQAPNGERLNGQDSFHLNRHNQIVYHDLQFQEPAVGD